MLVGGVVDHELGDDPQAPLVGGLEEPADRRLPAPGLIRRVAETGGRKGQVHLEPTGHGRRAAGD